ncbi:uncharacterized protein EURHEDRAFT_186676 [Aspergillus ruber CBS 135680]|uniref:Uncharacterized protein n=1 Tax=Aspergillus ruber (strain CBS 135680) TaxID=1388766 RepID=A0A017S7L3_ASPRC|nr:uncharacterized protein EURHEDRAFT_186676 [Aspergillus ruber CBS 135680]EYE92584.1 hypothetical protein EURHEDRAFT_186676 [Aspergillus ruber CBS 135680]
MYGVQSSIIGIPCSYLLALVIRHKLRKKKKKKKRSHSSPQCNRCTGVLCTYYGHLMFVWSSLNTWEYLYSDIRKNRSDFHQYILHFLT